MRRSLLFLPGNNPNMLINAGYLGSDAVIFDLEDAVSPAEKDAARILVRNTMRYMDLDCEKIVRINSVDTAYWKADIDAMLPEKPNLLLLPKASSPEDVIQVAAYMDDVEEKLGYPVLMRPSYVLGGQGMEIAYSDRNIEEFMKIINMTVQEHPILVDKYLMGRELEVDGGVDAKTAPVCKAAGANVLVSGSAFFKAADKAALQRMMGLHEDPNVPMMAIVSRLVSHKGVDLIDEKDDLAIAVDNLLHDPLKSLLKLSLILCTRYKCAKIKRIYLPALQVFRHITVYYLLRDSL